MRITVVHNARGDISALVASSPDAPPAQMQVRPGQLVSEIDAPKDIAALDSSRIYEGLSDLAQNYRIEVRGTSALTPRADDADASSG